MVAYPSPIRTILKRAASFGLAVFILSGCSAVIEGTAVAPANVSQLAKHVQPFPAPTAPGQFPADMFEQIHSRGVTAENVDIAMGIFRACTILPSPEIRSERDAIRLMRRPPGILSADDAAVVLRAAVTYMCPKMAGKLDR